MGRVVGGPEVNLPSVRPAHLNRRPTIEREGGSSRLRIVYFVFLLAGIHNVNDTRVSAPFADDGSNNNNSDRKLNDSMFDAASP